MSCKSSLFPILEEEVGPLRERAKQLVATLGMIPLARFVPSSKGWIGRPSRTATPSHARLGPKPCTGLRPNCCPPLFPRRVSGAGYAEYSRVRVLLLQQAGHGIVEP